jgi:glycosyltransferase involved in cell wall biosynthesis
MPEARFLVVGDGSMRAELQSQARALALDKCMLFLGMRSDVSALLSAMDVLVFSSLWEGLPVALLEGMAAGLPIVATKVGGIPSVVQDGTTGILVSPADAVELANGILGLLRSDQLAKQMGTAGQQRVRAKFSEREMAERITGLYTRLLAGEAPRP